MTRRPHRGHGETYLAAARHGGNVGARTSSSEDAVAPVDEGDPGGVPAIVAFTMLLRKSLICGALHSLFLSLPLDFKCFGE